ncbi:hypothetical protein BMW23_0372 [Bodo saltans virus]|uniref:Uncharacterized protein n=1 Tax=Bodo saltans virus TaxID=2024608 RepID=A0A2H4UU87_9VIRU|nr:hypothetical protein QJ851_gp0363 [Bodo saltans virus]ATZ80426.1 hypothetical protein BMW23_0372 [Bodo saltans virus]
MQPLKNGKIKCTYYCENCNFCTFNMQQYLSLSKHLRMINKE